MTVPPKRSIAPLFWLLFGAGGMLSALFGTGMVIVTGVLLPGHPPSYEAALTFARLPLVKLVLFGVISLFFWHGAERLYLTLKDMRAGPKPILKLATYGVAALLTLFTFALLLSIGF
jgi:fumarate reductase subunit D